MPFSFDQNIAIVSVNIEHPQVENGNFVNFIVVEQVTGVVFNRTITIDELLQRSYFQEGSWRNLTDPFQGRLLLLGHVLRTNDR
jgi:hypothetical protein